MLRTPIVAILLFASTAAAQVRRRQSADGTPYPPATERRVNVDLPYAHRMLGALPEEVSRGLRSKAAAEKSLRERGLSVAGDFIDFNVAGADAVGITLADGRVRRVDLVLRSLTPAKAEALRKQLARIDPGDDDWAQFEVGGVIVRATVAAAGERQGLRGPPLPGLITYEITPAEWYVLHNDPPKEVGDAMRVGKIVKGMTLGEAKLVLGEPDGESDDGAAKEYHWTIRTPGSKRLQRVVRASVEKDRIDAVSDQRF